MTTPKGKIQVKNDMPEEVYIPSNAAPGARRFYKKGDVILLEEPTVKYIPANPNPLEDADTRKDSDKEQSLLVTTSSTSLPVIDEGLLTSISLIQEHIKDRQILGYSEKITDALKDVITHALKGERK